MDDKSWHSPTTLRIVSCDPDMLRWVREVENRTSKRIPEQIAGKKFFLHRWHAETTRSSGIAILVIDLNEFLELKQAPYQLDLPDLV